MVFFIFIAAAFLVLWVSYSVLSLDYLVCSKKVPDSIHSVCIFPRKTFATSTCQRMRPRKPRRINSAAAVEAFGIRRITAHTSTADVADAARRDTWKSSLALRNKKSSKSHC